VRYHAPREAREENITNPVYHRLPRRKCKTSVLETRTPGTQLRPEINRPQHFRNTLRLRPQENNLPIFTRKEIGGDTTVQKTQSTPVTIRHQYLVTHTPPHHNISRLLPLIYHHAFENLRIGHGVEAPAVLEALEAAVKALERTPGGFGRAEHLGRSSSRFWAGK
jgi:hypothetical protein